MLKFSALLPKDQPLLAQPQYLKFVNLGHFLYLWPLVHCEHGAKIQNFCKHTKYFSEKMEDWSNFLTKASINARFVQAILRILQTTDGLTKSSLAEELCSKPAKFSEILNGRMNAGVDMIARVCELFNVSPDWIILSRGPMFIEEGNKKPYFVWDGDGATAPEIDPDQRDSKIHENVTSNGTTETLLALLREKDAEIRSLSEEIGALKERLRAHEIPKNSSSTVVPQLETETATLSST